MKIQSGILAIGIATLLSIQSPIGYTADTIRFAHVYEVSHPLHKAALVAAERYAELT